MNFYTYYRKMFSKPGTAFEELLTDKQAKRYAFNAVGITAIVYTFVYVFLILGHGLPFQPWLNIAPEEYYQYNVFFCAPSMFLAWFLAAAVMHILSNLFAQQGTFDQTLVVSGFGLSIASWATGIHDLLTSFLGAANIINQNEYELALNSPTIWRTLLWIQMALYLILFVFFFGKGIKAVYRMSSMKAFLIGFGGFVIYQGFFFIFNR